jgi:signal transduction histidine kinase
VAERTDNGAVALATTVQLPGGREASLRLALGVLAACGFLLGVIQLAVGLGNPELLWAVRLFNTVFWVWMAAGILAWWRRPNNATGALIVIGGLAVFVGGLGNLGIEVLAVFSAIFATAVLAVAVHLLHAFPSGRLHGRLSVTTVVVAYVVAIGLQAAQVFVPSDRPELLTVLSLLQRIVGLGVMLLTAVILTSRLIRADRTHRTVLLPLFIYGSLAVLLIPLAPNVLPPLGVDSAAVATIQLAITAGLPIAFLLGVLLGGFTRTGDLEALSAWLGIGEATKPAVALALARTLGDSSLRVVYWAPERSSYVNEFGVDVDPSQYEAHRGWLEVRVGSRLVGAIVYDKRMIGDPYPVRRAGEVLAIAVDRERLTAELLASKEKLLQSRLRLVETADRERSRIAQDLHDGLQVQLVLLALEAQKIANAPEASATTSSAAARLRGGIDEAAADLRRLVHNVLPAALVEQGLVAAIEDLVDRLAIPATLDADLTDEPLAPATIHTAYFIVAEVLTNAVKHSRASTVTVRLHRPDARLRIDIDDNGVGGASASRGSGLRGLFDRVDVLGGTVTIDSPRGHGTQVRAELPCGS